MSANPVALAEPAAIVYPSSDGQPMADNSEQARWIMTLCENLEALYADQPNILVVANNIWYPLVGRPEVCRAPDVYVVFGRPKGKRDSYQQWLEDDIPLTVVFEIHSPEQTAEVVEKLLFYEHFGVEEWYGYDPETNRLEIYTSDANLNMLRRRRPEDGFVSPRMGIRFDLSSGDELIVRYPDGRPFVRLKDERKRADKAEERANKAEERADKAEERAAEERRLRLRYRELSRKARGGEATPEEIAELDQLEAMNGP